MVGMNIGKLDRRIELQARALTQDAAGSRIETWAKVMDLWAELVAPRQSEGIIADADRVSDTREFRIRYRAGISATTHRVLYGGQAFDITGITEGGRREWLALTCTAIQPLTH